MNGNFAFVVRNLSNASVVEIKRYTVSGSIGTPSVSGTIVK